MKLARAVRFVESCFTDPQIDAALAAGDNLSSSETKHGKDHALDVHKLGMAIAGEMRRLKPGLFDPWTMRVVLPLSLYLHDIGRCRSVENHDIEGERWVNEHLPAMCAGDGEKALPLAVIRRIGRNIRNHRPDRYQASDFRDPSLDVLVIADKCIDDENRVRPIHAMALRALSRVRLAWIPLRRGGRYDRVVLSIKESRLHVDRRDGAVVLKLRVDSRICPHRKVYEVMQDRYESCEVAARNLGSGFSLEFDGKRFVPGR